MNGTTIRILAAASLAAAVALAGCGQRSSTLLEEPLGTTVKTESNTHSLMAWTDAGVRADVLIHIDASDDIAIFHESMEETFRNTADHLKRKNSSVVNRVARVMENGGAVNLGLMAGMYDRVRWVLP